VEMNSFINVKPTTTIGTLAKSPNKQQNLKFLLNPNARNVMLCVFSEEEYTKVHSFRSVKQIWDTLAATYEGTS